MIDLDAVAARVHHVQLHFTARMHVDGVALVVADENTLLYRTAVDGAEVVHL